MKRVFKWLRVIVIVLVAFLLIGFVAIPLLFPIEKIKDLATAKISATLGREVKIEKVSFNLFTGIKLEKITIANRSGFAKEPFVSADALTLRYAFWPLFQRQIIVQEVRLDNPRVLVEKNSAGEFNFSDIMAGQPAAASSAPAAKKHQDLGFSLIVDSFVLHNGQINYIDYRNQTKSQLNHIQLSLSGITLALLKPLPFNLSAAANYQGKDIPLSLSGRIALNLADEKINLPDLTLGIAGEKAIIPAQVSDLRKGPDIIFSLTSSKLGIDPLLAIFAAGTPTKTGKADLNKTVNQFASLVPSRLQIQGKIDLANLTFLNFKADKIVGSISLENKKLAADIKEVKIYGGTLKGKTNIDLQVPGLGYSGQMKLEGFNAAPFSNAVVMTFLTSLPDYKDLVDKVHGTLDVDLIFSGRGVNASDIMANADASGSFSLRAGALKRLKSLDALADKLKAPALKQELKVSELSSGMKYKNQVLTLKQLTLRDHDINIFFSGGLDLKRGRYVTGNRLTLKGAPSLTQNLPKEFVVFKDEKGWLMMEFELQGELKKPLPVPQLNKPFEATIGKFKVKIEAKKVEIQQAVQNQVSAEVDQIKQEGQKQIEKGKEQLKNLIKF